MPPEKTGAFNRSGTATRVVPETKQLLLIMVAISVRLGWYPEVKQCFANYGITLSIRHLHIAVGAGAILLLRVPISLSIFQN